MNIFILDHDIERCARYHCDAHVSKMILESVQIICTALNSLGVETPYKSTHACCGQPRPERTGVGWPTFPVRSMRNTGIAISETVTMHRLPRSGRLQAGISPGVN